LAQRAEATGVEVKITGHWEYNEEHQTWSLWIDDEEVVRAVRSKNYGIVMMSCISEWVHRHVETLERWCAELFQKSDAGIMDRQVFEIDEESDETEEPL